MLLTLSTAIFEDKDAAVFMPMIKESGFKRLEISDKGQYNLSTMDVLRKKALENGIEIPLYHLMQGTPFIKSMEPNEENIEEVKKSIELGVASGALNHVLHWTNRFKDRRNDILWQEIVDDLVLYAKSLGARLLMETVPHKPSNERYIPSSEIMDFVMRYSPEEMGICLDVNHSNLQEKLDDVVEIVKDRLVSIHLSDNDGKSEKHWLPGQGVIDFQEFFDSLKRVGFNGTIVIEVGLWPGAPENMQEALNDLYRFCEYLLRDGFSHPDTPLL